MQPEHFAFGGGAATSTANPIVILIVLLIGVLILTLRRPRVIMPVMLTFLLIPFGQVIVVAGLHFQMLRLVTVIVLIRMIWSGVITGRDKPALPISHPLDRLVIYCAVAGAVAFLLRFPLWDAFINQLGNLLTSLGVYFALRFLIRDQEDVIRCMKSLALVAALGCMLMMFEDLTGRNLVGYIGGVPVFAALREGRVRAQAFFENPILAGSFGATLFPLTVCLWLHSKKTRKYAVLCALGATGMTLASASSTPALAYLAGLLAFAFWPMRKAMRIVRWGIVVMLICLHLVMKGPVWSLIAHIDIIGGNSADHRYQLVNQCILHFREWWLIGTSDNGNWGWDMWDTANQYVGTAESGGIVTLLFFIAIIARGFQSIGKARRAVSTDRTKQLFFWSIGAALFAHCAAFFGIGYYDQTIVSWDALLIMIIVSTGAAVVVPEAASVPSRIPDKVKARFEKWEQPATTSKALSDRFYPSPPLRR
jgi:hypothetical protein